MNKKAIIIGCVAVVAVIGILLVAGFMNSDSNQAKKILEQYMQEQTEQDVALSINDYENTGVVTDESKLGDYKVELSDSIKLNKLYIFLPKTEGNYQLNFLVDVANKQVYQHEVRKPLPNSSVRFLQSLIPGTKMVFVTLETENPQDYKVSYSGVELTYQAEVNGFIGEVEENVPEDLKPE